MVTWRISVISFSTMDWAGFDEDTPIENKMISKSIENAQVKVEGYHFDIRKHLVEYDDVVNTHRDVIYGERDKILREADLKLNIQSMVEKEIAEILNGYLEGRANDNWDTDGLLKELSGILPIPVELSDPDELADMSREDIEEGILEQANGLYRNMEETITPEETRRLERSVMLRVVDQHWVQHLTARENLRQGIGLHAFGQRDPLVMYKKEGFESFQNLQTRMQHDMVHTIYHLGGMVQEQQTNGNRPANRNRQSAKGNASIMTNVIGTRKEAVSAGSSKVGRNAPCPCGSGKKYKRCHGSAA